ncbi:MAG: hypothetical protein FJX35_15885 [Alphaproteobacteria bacterium]|nr:hypothetical protein [Alphaproteobacteria bacterium]
MKLQFAAAAAFALIAADAGAVDWHSARPKLQGPQALGVVATRDAVPVTCEDGRCTAYLGAFCLEEKVLPPDHGTLYRANRAGDVVLTVTAADGRTRRIDSAETMEIFSHLGFNALKIVLKPATAASLGSAKLAVEVAERAAVVPVEEQVAVSAEDRAIATGSHRSVAEAVFERAEERADAARLATDMINALPERREVSEALRRSLWERVATPHATRGMTPSGVDKARTMFNACNRTVDISLRVTLRDCLEGRHTDVMKELNDEFWKMLGGV